MTRVLHEQKEEEEAKHTNETNYHRRNFLRCGVIRVHISHA